MGLATCVDQVALEEEHRLQGPCGNPSPGPGMPTSQGWWEGSVQGAPDT